MCIYIYTHIYIYIHTKYKMYGSQGTHCRKHFETNLSLFVYAHMYVCTYLFICFYSYLYVYVHSFLYVFLFEYAFLKCWIPGPAGIVSTGAPALVQEAVDRTLDQLYPSPAGCLVETARLSLNCGCGLEEVLLPLLVGGAKL